MELFYRFFWISFGIFMLIYPLLIAENVRLRRLIVKSENEIEKGVLRKFDIINCISTGIQPLSIALVFIYVSFMHVTDLEDRSTGEMGIFIALYMSILGIPGLMLLLTHFFGYTLKDVAVFSKGWRQKYTVIAIAAYILTLVIPVIWLLVEVLR